MDELSNLFGGAEQVWQYITQYAAKAGREATRIVLESYYVVKSPNTPAIDKTIIIAALGYQLLPNDLMSKEKFGWLGFLDNGAALAFAYNRVQTRLTPQIENQVNTILDQWFGEDHRQQIDSHTSSYDIPTGQNPGTYWEPQPVSFPNTPSSNNTPPRPARPVGGFDEDEEVVID
jgi:uncharacterized membrane protein YkvA (DUF1232 family)